MSYFIEEWIFLGRIFLESATGEQKKKMPQHIISETDHIEELVKGGGLKDATLSRRKKVSEDFSRFVQDSMKVTVQELYVACAIRKLIIGTEIIDLLLGTVP